MDLTYYSTTAALKPSHLLPAAELLQGPAGWEHMAQAITQKHF
jgi:hypothetical protein